MISPFLASGVQVGRLCWEGQGPVVLVAGGRPTNLDNSRARAYYVCRRCALNIFSSRESFLFSFSLSLGRMNGWITWDFTFFSTEFKLYQSGGWVMDDCVQWNHVYD